MVIPNGGVTDRVRLGENAPQSRSGSGSGPDWLGPNVDHPTGSRRGRLVDARRPAGGPPSCSARRCALAGIVVELRSVSRARRGSGPPETTMRARRSSAGRAGVRTGAAARTRGPCRGRAPRRAPLDHFHHAAAGHRGLQSVHQGAAGGGGGGGGGGVLLQDRDGGDVRQGLGEVEVVSGRWVPTSPAGPALSPLTSMLLRRRQPRERRSSGSGPDLVVPFPPAGPETRVVAAVWVAVGGVWRVRSLGWATALVGFSGRTFWGLTQAAASGQRRGDAVHGEGCRSRPCRGGAFRDRGAGRVAHLSGQSSAAGLIRGTRSESPRCYPYSFCASPVPVFDLMSAASSEAAPPVAV